MFHFTDIKAAQKQKKQQEAARKRASKRLPGSFYWLLLLAIGIYVAMIVIWTQNVDYDITMYTFIGAFPVFGILALLAIAMYYRMCYLRRT